MDIIKSESAKNILARSYDGGHICYENAEAAVEVAEKEMIQKLLKRSAFLWKIIVANQEEKILQQSRSTI